jgi:hypothetical protein
MRWAARLSKSFAISRGGSCIEVWETDLEGLHEKPRALLGTIAKRDKPTPYVSPIEGASQYFEQEPMIEWFCEELDCTLLHGLSPCFGLVIRCNKDDRNVALLLLQPGLQLQTRHLRHADVNDQARGLAKQIRFEESRCRSEAFRFKSPRLDQVTQ